MSSTKKTASKKEKTSTKKSSKEKKEKPDSKEVIVESTPAPPVAPPINSSTNNNLPVSLPIPGEIFSGRHLTHYDETSGIAIPQSEVDNHIRRNHTVRTLIDAYSDRYERLRLLLTSKLLPKRERLLQIYRNLKENSDKIITTQKFIEKETLIDTEQILDRLKSKASLRQSAIQHELIHVEEELQSIEGIIKRVERANLTTEKPPSDGIILNSVVPASSSSKPLYSNPSIMVEVIQEFGDLSALIDRISNKIVQVQVDFPTDDFPRETSERREILDRCDKYLHAVNVKDQLLWLSLQEKEKLQQSLNEERKLCQEYALEIGQWAELVQRCKQENTVLQSEKTELERQNLYLRQILRNHGIFVE